MAQSPWIYFVRVDDFVKIGRTGGLETRLNSYRKRFNQVVLIDAFRENVGVSETLFHRYFESHRAFSREYYFPSINIEAFLDSFRDQQTGLLRTHEIRNVLINSHLRRPNKNESDLYCESRSKLVDLTDWPLVGLKN